MDPNLLVNLLHLISKNINPLFEKLHTKKVIAKKKEVHGTQYF